MILTRTVRHRSMWQRQDHVYERPVYEYPYANGYDQIWSFETCLQMYD